MALPIEPLKQPYLFVDTETGGLDPARHSLLSLGFVLGDADGNAVTYGFRHGAAPGMAIALGSFGS